MWYADPALWIGVISFGAGIGGLIGDKLHKRIHARPRQFMTETLSARDPRLSALYPFALFSECPTCRQPGVHLILDRETTTKYSAYSGSLAPIEHDVVVRQCLNPGCAGPTWREHLDDGVPLFGIGTPSFNREQWIRLQAANARLNAISPPRPRTLVDRDDGKWDDGVTEVTYHQISQTFGRRPPGDQFRPKSSSTERTRPMPITATLGGTPVTIHTTAELDVGSFVDWARGVKLFGHDSEGLEFDHEDQVNHFGPLQDRWLRLVQLADSQTAWNLDPKLPTHRAALIKVFGDRSKQFTTWGSFDPESVAVCLGVDTTDRYYSGMTLANLLRPGPLESHKLKEWAHRLGMPELREAEELQEAHWATLSVSAPRKPSRPRRRLRETDDEYAARLLTWRTDTLVKWQRAVQEHYERYPRRADDRATPAGGFKSGWSAWRDIDRDDTLYQTYAGLDAIAARRVWPLLVQMAKERGVFRAVPREVRLEQGIVSVKIVGTLTDSEYAASRLDEVRPRHLEAKASFEELTGVKAGSSKRVEWFKERGLKWPKHAVTKTGAPSLGGQHVKDMLARHAPDEPGGPPSGVTSEVYRALQLVGEAGSTQNLTTFFGGLIKMTDQRGRIHPQFNVLGAKTGRWTARKPAVQTFSRTNGTRGIVVPEPGHVLVSFDQKQIEVRVFAGVAKCHPLITAFNDNEDIYGVVAERLFGPSWGKEQRAMSKRIILGGCLYGGGPGTLVTQLHDLDGVVVREEAVRETRADFYTAYPEARRFIRRMTSSDDVWLPSGRFVPGDPDKEYRGTNSYCQGTARDLLVDTLVDTWRLGYQEHTRLVVHDEVIYSLPIAGLQDHLERIRSCFRRSFMGVKIDTDVEVYPERWGGRMFAWTDRDRWVVGKAEVTGTLEDVM